MGGAKVSIHYQSASLAPFVVKARVPLDEWPEIEKSLREWQLR